MNQVTKFGNGAIDYLKEIIQETQPRTIFLVTGKDSYARCGAEAKLDPFLQGLEFTQFNEFNTNPCLPDVEKGLALHRAKDYDLIIAVGGGTVLDMAKLIAIFSAQRPPPIDILEKKASIEHPAPLVVAVPTTAGTGSEATHFAAIYVDHDKYSVAHDSMLPAYAIVDPELTFSLPPEVTASNGLDAFCQAVESLWSVNSTSESTEYAKEAISLAFNNLQQAVHASSPEARTALSKAAHLAGKAINISKTTAPHALSYAMTSYFGVTHGQAVALTISEMLLYNNGVTELDVTDNRGVGHVEQAISTLNTLLGCTNAQESSRRITQFIQSAGLATRLSDVGIRTQSDRQLIADQVNAQRLTNNPRVLEPGQISALLEKIA